MRRVVLEGRGNFEEWRKAARAFAAAGILPHEIDWHEKSNEPGFAFQRDALPPDPPANSKPMTVPPAFMTLAEAVISNFFSTDCACDNTEQPASSKHKTIVFFIR